VARFWFVGVDTVRLRTVLFGRGRLGVIREFASSAEFVGARVLDGAAIACGVRAVVAVSARDELRHIVRRFCASSAKWLPGTARWRSRALIAVVHPRELDAYLTYVRRCALAFPEETPMMRTAKKNAAGASRRAAALIREIERFVDGLLGADEAARRSRHYVADHDAPADDSTAYARLCAVIFAQGLGFEAVDAKREHFLEAFVGFAPEKVAAFDDDRVKLVVQAPIIRNEVKIRACVENARRWVGAAGDAAYLSRVAQVAVDDDAPSGWPALTQKLQEDFVRFGETAARQLLKRWGFFTAFAA
jgi:3-methyladenine DNA glycosylase Tag